MRGLFELTSRSIRQILVFVNGKFTFRLRVCGRQRQDAVDKPQGSEDSALRYRGILIAH